MKLISRFWSGSPMPADYREFGDRWAQLNPDWRLHDFTFSEAMDLTRTYNPELLTVLDDLTRRDAGRLGIEYFTQCADVFGYVLIHAVGGVYVNVDICPIRSMSELFEVHQPLHRPYAHYEDQGSLISNAVLGGPECDQFWALVLSELPGHYFAHRYEEMNQATGPVFLTKMAAKYAGQLYVLPEVSFNPVHWKRIPDGGNAEGLYERTQLSPQTIGVHNWGHKKARRTNYIETATQWSPA